MSDRWDVILEGRDESDPSYKARVKRYTIRDSLEKTQLERKLIDATPKGDADRDIGLLYLVNNYPLIRFGLEAAEGFKVPLDANTFWKLPEIFVLDLTEAIREVNPQYAIPFSEWLKLRASGSLNPSEPSSVPTPTADENAKTS